MYNSMRQDWGRKLGSFAIGAALVAASVAITPLVVIKGVTGMVLLAMGAARLLAAFL